MHRLKNPVYTTSQRRFINRVNAVDCSQQNKHQTEARSLPPSTSGTGCGNTRRTGFGISLSKVSFSQVETSSSRSIKTIFSWRKNSWSPAAVYIRTMYLAPRQPNWLTSCNFGPPNGPMWPPEIQNRDRIFLIIAVLDTVGDIHCTVVPDRPTLCHPFFRWVMILQTLQLATKQSTKGVCHGRRANRKRANRNMANRNRANWRTWIHWRANPGSGFGLGSRIGHGGRMGRRSRINRGSANGRVRSQVFLLPRRSQLSRGSTGRCFLTGWPGGVIGPLSFPLALFVPLLHNVHQVPPYRILPALTI